MSDAAKSLTKWLLLFDISWWHRHISNSALAHPTLGFYSTICRRSDCFSIILRRNVVLNAPVRNIIKGPRCGFPNLCFPATAYCLHLLCSALQRMFFVSEHDYWCFIGLVSLCSSYQFVPVGLSVFEELFCNLVATTQLSSNRLFLLIFQLDFLNWARCCE